MDDLVVQRGGTLQNYDPETAMKVIRVADAAIEHFARAKDTEKLREAVERKLQEQARYVVWRDGNPISGIGGDKKSDHVARARHDLPDSDPGRHVIYRWRKKLCSKDDNNKTYINDDKVEVAAGKAVERCITVCEGTAAKPRPSHPKPKPLVDVTSINASIDDPIQEECEDCVDQPQRWQRSLENFAGDAARMRPFWKKLFGEWETFEPSKETITLAEQAASEWAEIVRHLKSRRRRK